MKLLNLFRVPYSEEVHEVFLKFLISSRRGLVVPIIIIALVVTTLWGKVPNQVLLLWGALAYIITGVRFLSFPLQACDVEPKQVKYYLLRFAWSTNVYGLIWGLGVVTFIPYLPFEYVVFLILILIGITMAFVFLAVSLSSMLVFPCLLLPPSIYLLMDNNVIYTNLGVLMLLFLFFIHIHYCPMKFSIFQGITDLY